MCLKRRKKSKSKILSHEFRLFDSEAEQKALQFSGILGLNVTITTQLLNQIDKICETEL